jgi:hypothetical protein
MGRAVSGGALPRGLSALIEECGAQPEEVVTVGASGQIIALDFTDRYANSDHDFEWLRDLPDLERLRVPIFEERDGRSPLILPLEKCPRLRELGATAPEGFDLSPLRACSTLEVLDLRGSLFEAIDLSPLTGCPALRRLELGHNLLGEIDLRPLAACPQLEYLDLSIMSDVEANERHRLRVIDLSPLARSDALETLLLGGNSLRAIDLSPLSGKERFRTLTLFDHMFTEVDLAPLARCPALELLHLGYKTSYYYPATMTAPLERVDLGPLSECGKLKTLYVGSARLRDLNLSPLARVPLETLVLSGERLASVDLGPLAGHASLRHLDLGQFDWLLQIELAPLSGMAGLEVLRVRATSLSDVDLGVLPTLPRLRDLYLGGHRDDTSALDLAPLARCRALERVMILGEKLAPLDLSPLARAPLLWLNLCAYNPDAELDFAPLLDSSTLAELLVGRRPVRLPAARRKDGIAWTSRLRSQVVWE